jgi:hypothetical protein
MLSSILWLLLAIIVVAWLFGAFVANLGGIVHLLLIIAAIILIYNLFVGMAGGRRTTL